MNTGREQLIIQKDSGTIGSCKVVKVKTNADIRGFSFWDDVEIEHRGEAGKILNLDFPSPDEFVILKKGESFEKESLLTLWRGGPGEYLITAEVETWIDRTGIGSALQERWKKWGRLWRDSFVTAEPLRVTIPSNPMIEDCSQDK